MNDVQNALPSIEETDVSAQASQAAILAQAELELKRQELALKREEFLAQLEYQKHEKKKNVSSLAVAAIAAIAGISGSVVGAISQYVNEARKSEIEVIKFKSGIVSEAIKNCDSPDKVADNLRFLIQVGLLEDTNGSITHNLEAIRPQNLEIIPKDSQNTP